MNKNEDFKNMSDKIKNFANDAIGSDNFNKMECKINNIISDVNVALGEIPKAATNTQYQKTKNAQKKYYKDEELKEYPLYSANKKKENVKYTIGKVPSVSVGGVLLTVFGSILTLASAVTFTIFAIIYAISEILITGVLISGAAMIPSIIMLYNGIKNIKKNMRFKKYRKRIQETFFCKMEVLMLDVGKRKNIIVKDLQEMRRIGYIDELYLDKKKTCIMLDGDTFSNYERCLSQTITNKKVENNQIDGQLAEENQKSLNKILEKGKQQLAEIQNQKNLITDTSMTIKVEEFYKITSVIFDSVKKSPDKIDEIRKVYEYYLPTAIKLLNIFIKLDVQIEELDNIINSKIQIKEAFNTLNEAFKELLDNLFEGDAMDIATDISVLETMLAQEGLVGNDDFKINPK